MGFLADGADNPIFNPPLRITRPALPSPFVFVFVFVHYLSILPTKTRFRLFLIFRKKKRKNSFREESNQIGENMERRGSGHLSA